MNDTRIRVTESRGRETARSIGKSIAGLLSGAATSVADPYAIPKAFKSIRERKVKGVPEFLFYFTGGLAYFAGLAASGYLIKEYGADRPEAWLPLVTNLVSGAGQYGYRKRIRDEARERESGFRMLDREED